MPSDIPTIAQPRAREKQRSVHTRGLDDVCSLATQEDKRATPLAGLVWLTKGALRTEQEIR